MEPLNVLVVVDVQNCFMFSSDDKANFLNLADKNDSQAIANEIADLTTKNDIVVFTRDYHPINHISFENDEGRESNPPNTWPRHCRNQFRKCKTRLGAQPTEDTSSIPVYTRDDKIVQGINNTLSTKGLPTISSIKGTDLSYLFYNTSIATIVSELTTKNKRGLYKIGLGVKDASGKKLSSTERDEDKVIGVDPATRITVDDIAWENVVPFEDKGTKFVTLTKGEDCSRESYSAFNYHIEYDISNPANPSFTNFESINKDNSTGLWEWILNQNNGASRKIIITVCGLVGNVCVMHTVLQGMTMWEQLYKNDGSRLTTGVTVEFVLSLKGTRFTPVLPPAIVNPVTPDQLTHKEGEIFPQSMSYVDWMTAQLPKFKDNNEMKPYSFPDFSIAFPDGRPPLSSGELLQMNNTVPAAGGKRTRRMRMRRTRKQHKKQCKCTSCACNKRKSRRRARRSHRRR